VGKNSKSSKKVTPKKSISVGTPSVSGAVLTDNKIEPIVGTNDITTSEQKKLQEMIALAQLEYQKIKTTVVKEKKKELETLDLQIKEFVGPFMLIGYDLSNNPIEMISASSPAEHDALLERLRRVMYKINQNIANSGGNDPYGFNSN
jgi:hypothetical protein